MGRGEFPKGVEVLIIMHFLWSTPISSAFECYQCNGVLCSSVHRGCYGPGRYMVHECNRYRNSRCAVCSKNLCNVEVFAKHIITCRICARGVCSVRTNKLGFYRACPRFRYPELPRCVTIVDPWTMEYTFGCANELTLEQHELCDGDYAESVCRICDTPNCNKQFLYPFNKPLSCYTKPDADPLQCRLSGNKFGYYGCYRDESNKEKVKLGCFNDLFQSSLDPLYQNLWAGHNYTGVSVCPSANCNSKDMQDQLTYCGEKEITCPLMREHGGLCARYNYTDHTGHLVVDHGCVGRFPCWKTSECDLMCRGNCKKLTIAGVKLRQCFVCTDCPQVNPLSPLLSSICEDTTTCVMVVTPENGVMRGCYTGNVGSLCDQFVSTCVKCSTDGCNMDPATIFCHQCTPYNPMCAYTQIDVLSYECEGLRDGSLIYSFDKKAQCYSGIDVMGRVTRGCISASKYCPAEFVNCTKCAGNYCNDQSYVFANCLSCHGNFNSSCAHNVTYLASRAIEKRCAVGYDIPHCYLSVRNGVLRRGCVADEYYREVMLVSCSYSQDCFFCEGANCNYWSIYLVAVPSTNKPIPSHRIVRPPNTVAAIGLRGTGSFPILIWGTLVVSSFICRLIK